LPVSEKKNAATSGFEFLLDFGDGRTELRIGDRAPLLGGRMPISAVTGPS